MTNKEYRRKMFVALMHDLAISDLAMREDTRTTAQWVKSLDAMAKGAAQMGTMVGIAALTLED